MRRDGRRRQWPADGGLLLAAGRGLLLTTTVGAWERQGVAGEGEERGWGQREAARQGTAAPVTRTGGAAGGIEGGGAVVGRKEGAITP